jgi:hypothetical protein
MDELPPPLAGFAILLDAQPEPVRNTFAYCLCLMIVEVGKMRLVETLPGDASPIGVFETIAGDSFGIPRPPMSQEEEAALIEVLRSILEDEGLL